MERTNEKILLPYNLQFFAKEGSGGEKTEDATAKKLSDARKEGQVAKSADLIAASLLLMFFLVLKYFLGYIGDSFLDAFKGAYGFIKDMAREEFTKKQANKLLTFGVKEVVWIVAPLLLGSVFIAFIMNIAQVKWKPTTKPLMPKMDKINPVSGMKKLISLDKIVDLVKAIAKMGVLFYVVYDGLKEQWVLLEKFYSMPLNQAVALIGKITIDMGVKISLIFMVIALIDYLYQKFKFKKDMKMSKQEIKDEYKQSEGDPQIKGKIRAKMREVSQRRMMQALPEADVVITNPTHLAVAIKYNKDTAGAPIVIAKGADFLAEKIKGIAKENKIEIVENKPLARMLYYNVDIDEEIPPELYQTVAEVLAYVYGLQGKL